MAAPSFVYTVACVAKMLGEPEEWLDELASMNLGPEDGCLGIIDDLDGPAEQLISVTAFTDAGIEALKELVADAKQQSSEAGGAGRSGAKPPESQYANALCMPYRDLERIVVTLRSSASR